MCFILFMSDWRTRIKKKNCYVNYLNFFSCMHAVFPTATFF